MTGQFEFQVTTHIIYSRNGSSSLGEIVSRFGKNRYQLITDAGVAGAGILDGLLESLKLAGIDTVLFDEVEVNPTVQTVDKACKQYENEKCEGVIAVGGGSPMDTGKSVGILATNPGSASDYLGPDA